MSKAKIDWPVKIVKDPTASSYYRVIHEGTLVGHVWKTAYRMYSMDAPWEYDAVKSEIRDGHPSTSGNGFKTRHEALKELYRRVGIDRIGNRR